MVIFSALAAIKILGGATALSYGLARLTHGRRWVEYSGFRLIAIPVSALPKMPRGYRVVSLDTAALSIHKIDVSTEIVADRFNQGLECLGAFNAANDLVGVIWLGRQGYSEGKHLFTFCPPSDGAWDTGLWVHPDYRMSRAFAALWAGGREWLGARNLQWSYSAVSDYNIASMRSHSRLGMMTLGFMLILRIGTWRLMGGRKSRWQLVRGDAAVDWIVPKV